MDSRSDAIISDNMVNKAPMSPFNVEEFRQSAHQMVEFLADYYRDIESYPVRSQVEPGYLYKQIPDTAPESPETLDEVFSDVKSKILPGITHWLSPQFHAYYPASFSTAGYLGEMLCGGLNVNGFSWIASPAATELEVIVVEWLGKLLNLPKEFLSSGGGGGIIEGTACEAVFVCILAARKRFVDKYTAEGLLEGEVHSKLVAYTSDQTHSCVAKACKMAGVQGDNLRILPTDASTDFALSPAVLLQAIENDIAAGFIPFFVCGTVGTTSSSAVDPLHAIGDLAKSFGMWFHIDAAYAGSACICPEFRPFLDGVEKADSFCLNPHKWLLINFDSSCLWVKDPKALESALSTDPEYLKNKHSDEKNVIDFRNLQLPLSRRFRAVKLWMVMRMYGASGLRTHIRNGVRMAKHFESLVKANRHFEIVTPRNFALVCFRVKPQANDPDNGKTINQKLMDTINANGTVFFTHTVMGGVYTLRMAIGATMTQPIHVTDTWAIITTEANRLLGLDSEMCFNSDSGAEMCSSSDNESVDSDCESTPVLNLSDSEEQPLGAGALAAAMRPLVALSASNSFQERTECIAVA
ncbi:aromatic-L-amino-acid/L-tryptophan decarboxylase [Marchantia polymorpha subsp. ruderalis]|uniref:Tyrosine decarboxylase n=2 Tax=Marchantia polymorpha TaxID=3197 RepID=A0AAF6BWS9_MARPO|nr:hypothetical protein MARPO_0057s0014 [Marchantia polymorpha]BBN16463.1 hypothetical protein Mp_7g06530 [Marchantia polymorpha subsp. ruderalis]|eukprot:PTQ37374.1 hypothetical protein MARPO_0057s0014 [Marchantia polymorpha]